MGMLKDTIKGQVSTGPNKHIIWSLNNNAHQKINIYLLVIMKILIDTFLSFKKKCFYLER